MEDALKFGVVGAAIGGIGCIANGYFSYLLKLEQIALAPSYESIDSVRKEVTKDETSRAGFYCQINGVVSTESKPLLAPHSRKYCVGYESSQITSLKSLIGMNERRSIPFTIKDESGDIIDVEIAGADYVAMASAVRTLRTTERVLQMGKPLYVVGEVTVSHGNSLVIKRPRYGKAFVISGISSEKALRRIKMKGYIWMLSGIVALILSGVGSWTLFVNGVGHVFAPIL